MEDCIFCKIANGEVKTELIYEDEDLVVFPDQNPVKPIHLLAIPKNHIKDFSGLDNGLGGKIIETIQKMIKEKGLNDKGYQLVVNGGGAQFIDHLHFHIMGPMGSKVGWEVAKEV